MTDQTALAALTALTAEIVDCRRCPRLVKWRERVAREKARRFRDETYWGRPVPGFGDPEARILLLGLAPAAHGGNRTGRVFTGDASGDFLWAALHDVGLADRPASHRADDGLTLTDTYIAAAVRCAPPANKPTVAERDACAPFLAREMRLLDRLVIVVALGQFGWDAALRSFAALGHDVRPRPPFGHGAEVTVGPHLAARLVSPEPTEHLHGQADPGDVPRGAGAGKEAQRVPARLSGPQRHPPVFFTSSMATTERDYYLVLGIERTATDADIKRAYRKLAQQWHPDVNADPGAHDRFTEINEAYQILSDPERRGRYDQFGRAGLGGAGAAGFEGFGGFSDIFDAFFGGGTAANAARRGRPQPGADLRYDLRINFVEAVKGVEKEIEFPVLLRCETCNGSGAKPGTDPVTCPQCNGRGEVRSIRQTMLGQMVNVAACPRCNGEGRIIETPCDTCHGDGRTERRRTLRVTIPPGIDEGHQIRLSNEGEAGPRGGAAGSLYVAVHVQPHPSLKRDGTELYYEAQVSIVQAALGTRITVPTVDGDEVVEIKAGTQPETEIRLRGKGVPHLRRAGARGDLHVLVGVTVPTRLSKRARELLADYAVETGEAVDLGHGGIREKLGLG